MIEALDRFVFQEKIYYVGKDLPPHVSQARDRYKQVADALEQEAVRLRGRLAILEKLIAKQTLTKSEATTLKQWGIK